METYLLVVVIIETEFEISYKCDSIGFILMSGWEADFCISSIEQVIIKDCVMPFLLLASYVNLFGRVDCFGLYASYAKQDNIHSSQRFLCLFMWLKHCSCILAGLGFVCSTPKVCLWNCWSHPHWSPHLFGFSLLSLIHSLQLIKAITVDLCVTRYLFFFVLLQNNFQMASFENDVTNLQILY